MESIEIKNFGPIEHVKLDLKDINVFIGTTASGKSTVAKLVAIFRDMVFIRAGDAQMFKKLLVRHNLDYAISTDTCITYNYDLFCWKLYRGTIESDDSFNRLISEIFSIRSTLSRNDLDPVDEIDKAVSSSTSIEIENLVIIPTIIKIVNHSLEEGRQKILSKAGSTQQKEKLSGIINRIKDDTNKLELDKNVSLGDTLKRIDALFAEMLSVVGLSTPIYIPAERNLLSTVGQSLFGLMSNNVSIASTVKAFGAEFESARKQLKQLVISFLNTEYAYADGNNTLILEDSTQIKLEQASSGFQSIIPLLLVIEAEADEKSVLGKYFIIEEPELNLYPTVQKELLEFIVERINRYQNKLILTTHSPYVLTALDNLIQADNVVRQNPDAKEEVEKLVPSERWVNFDRVACYYFENGTCRSTLDEEQRSIGPSNIDDVSDTIGNIYDQLLAIKYDKVL